MSFLSTLLCCFDAEDSHKRENNHNINNRPKPKLTKTQSNLQKALTHSNSHINSNPNTPLLKSQPSAFNPPPSKMITNSDNNKITNHNIGINNITTGGTIATTGNNTATTDNNLSSNTGDGAVADSYDCNKNSNNGTPNSNDYKEIEVVDEISNSKDSTDSSKNEDDVIQIHENQTQSTDDTLTQNQNQNQNRNQNRNQNQNHNANEVQRENQVQSENINEATAYNDSNPISNLNPNDVTATNPISNLNPSDLTATSSFDYDELLYEQQFGISLTEILPGQTVAPNGWLLDEQPEFLKGKKCLVLDLDETLVHSSFKYVRQCDFVIPVEIENQIHNVYVIKRPGVDQFLERVGKLFEVVVFTASVSRYGDPLLNILDSNKSIHHRLFRDSCYNYQGNYIKNLSQMGRPLQDLIIIDNSPASYIFHPQHAVPISSWFSDSHDCELTDLLPFLEDLASSDVDDVRLALDINM